MAKAFAPRDLAMAAYHGEVWTDGRGYATVRLPEETDGPLSPPFVYELTDLEPASTARVVGEVEDGRFTIATDEPHVKVGWRIRGRRRAGPRDSGDGRGRSVESDPNERSGDRS
jgi:hypothetical protein